MIRIVFITTGLSTGGAEAMLLKLLERIDRRRFEPQVISLTSLGEVGSRISNLGIPVQALGMAPGFSGMLATAKLVGLMRKAHPDVVQTWMYHADLIGGIAARLAGCNKVAWGLRNNNLSAGMIKRSTRMVVGACALLSSWLPRSILCNSVPAGEVHVGAGYCRNKIRVIPNGFDLSRFRPDAAFRESVRSELGLPSNARLVGLMARYDPQKNHAGFIDAAATIRDALPKVHFVLAGYGVSRNNLRLNELIEERDLGQCMHLLDRRDDIPRLMAALDVLASSSYGEAFPNVLGEAMSCGVPCVVTDVGDSAEIVGDTGRVVQPGDMQGLAQQAVELLQMAADDIRALGLKARTRVEARYELGRVVRAYETLYEQLAQGIE